MNKQYFLAAIIVLSLLSCTKENAEPKVVFPDQLQSVRTSNSIKLSWYSPLILMDVTPEFFDKMARPEIFEIYLSKNDTLNFVKLEEFDRDENNYEYAENIMGVDYFFKLKCLAKNAKPSFSNTIWVNGGKNPEMKSILKIEVDRTIAMGDISKDEQRLLYSRIGPNDCCENAIMMYDLTTDTEIEIVAKANSPVFHPDEKKIAFASHFGIYNTTPWPTNLGLIDLETGKVDTLTGGQNEVQSPIFSENGMSIFFLNTPYNLPIEFIDYSLGDKSIEKLLVVQSDLNIRGPLSYSSPKELISFKGYYDDGTHGLYALDVNTKDYIILLEPTVWQESKGAFSDDGKYLAFSSVRSGQYEIWVKDLDINELYQLTGNNDGYIQGKLVWSSSNTRIFAAGYTNEKYGVFSIDFIP